MRPEMAICRSKLGVTGTKFHAGLIMSARLASAMILVAVASLSTHAADSALSHLDQQCLPCHPAKGLEMKLANGDVLSLQVQGVVFKKRGHIKIGWAVCHAATSFEN